MKTDNTIPLPIDGVALLRTPIQRPLDGPERITHETP